MSASLGSFTPVAQRVVTLARRPSGDPIEEDFAIVERALPPVGQDEILVENVSMSVDPSVRIRMREQSPAYMPRFDPGDPLVGFCVGRVLASRSSRFAEGDFVSHNLGWRDYEVLSTADKGYRGPARLEVDDIRTPTAYLNALGTSGLSAWAGLFRVGELHSNDVVYVSAGAGSVGSLVIQLAKLNGCTVIASAGSDEKADYITRVLGADHGFNYKTISAADALGSLVPDGIDLYFDNVGGEQLEAALDALRYRGRVVLCGQVSGYSGELRGPRNLFNAISSGLTLRGFLSRMYFEDLPVFRDEMTAWLRKGVIHQRETLYQGLDAVPTAFVDMLAGRTTGKVLVEIT